ncbi:hypothetical protein GCM10022378_11490 [Salinicoccus jeotgali]|uniref:RNA polymerase sigma-70 region 4 domain-containing protein n=1 Tax=Salinicoccus jeotgali TaxID=381634 RepID=A0ABP7ERR1_9STAP
MRLIEPTKDEVLVLINEYNKNINTIDQLLRAHQELSSSGLVSQYGDEAGMPKAVGGASEPILFEVDRRIKQDRMIDRYKEKVQYIQNRLDWIINEPQAIVLHHRLNGTSIKEISKIVNLSPNKVMQLLEECAEILTDK